MADDPAIEVERLLKESRERIDRLDALEREVLGLRDKCERMAELMAWAQEHGICIFGHNYNSDGKWSATLGMYHVRGHDQLLDAVAALKEKYGEFADERGGNNG